MTLRGRTGAVVLRLGGASIVALVALVASPTTPQVAAADDGLDLVADATYELQPRAGRVRVTVDLTATNTSPDSTSGGVVTQYYFEGIRLAVQPEAEQVIATTADRRLAVSTDAQRRFDVLDIRFRQPIYFGDRARVRLTYDLPGGEPRSRSNVRVGVAFATFVAWAFGDSGRVRIEVPAAFEVDTDGATVERARSGSTVVLTSGPIRAPDDWYAVVDARRDSALTSERLETADRSVVVRGWPEDREWVGRVSRVLQDGLPELDALVGLPWPVADEVEIIEVHTPLLEGYGGVYDTDTDTITVSEDLDHHVILHEVAHAWFNGSLFNGRWIAEGLADEYAATALGRQGEAAPEPPAVQRDDPAAFPLASWRDPRPISDDATAAYEDYGYDASWHVIGSIVERAGAEAMADVLRAARSREIAYLGEGGPGTMPATADWTRFLDLIEERADVEVTDLFREWVVPEGSLSLLDERAAARRSYDALVAAGDGWSPPYAVRGAMAAWRFPVALAQIERATEILDLRDRIEARAAALGVAVPAGLEAAYESAAADVSTAQGPAQVRLQGLDELEEAAAAVAAPRDILIDIGLIEAVAPEDALAAAKVAFGAGAFGDVVAHADAAVASLAAAPETGRMRVVAAVLIGIGLLVSLAALAAWLRTRRRRSTRLVGARIALGTLPPTSPGEAAGNAPVELASQGGHEPTD